MLQEDHRFPPTHKVIPKASDATAVVEIDAEKLAAATKRLAKLKIQFAKIHLGTDSIGITVEDDEAVTIDIPAKVEGNIAADAHHAEGSDIGVNLGYLQDSIAATGTITMRFQGPTDGIRVESGLLCVIMPVRL